MELFDQNGCLTEEGLHAVIGGQLDELGRLEAAEHLSYCDKCMDRYTALLTADVLEEPPRSARGGGDGHHLGAADAEHLGPGRRSRCGGGAGADHVAHRHPGTDPVHRRNGAHLAARNHPDHGAGTAGQARAGRRTHPTQPEQLGKPVQDKEPAPTLSQKLTGTLDSLLFGKMNLRQSLTLPFPTRRNEGIFMKKKMAF